jgi:hypothetical protein
MRTRTSRFALAATTVALLAVSAPVATARPVRSGCTFDAGASNPVVTGQDGVTGVLAGYAVFDDQATHSLRCAVLVDGAEQSSTSTGTGTGTVLTAGPTSYTAAPGSVVQVCTEVDGVFADCAQVTTSQVPPQEVYDLVDSLPPVREDAYGHIIITSDATGVSFVTTDRYQDSFSCAFTSSAPVTVTCHPIFPNAMRATAFYCGYWILTATTRAEGAVRGQASCLGNTGTTLSPGDVSTRDVRGNPDADTKVSALTYDINHDVTTVVCQAWGVSGTTTPVPQNYTVDCYEPAPPDA